MFADTHRHAARLGAACIALVVAACGDPVEVRHRRQLEASAVQLGPDGRIGVQVSPGRPSVERDDGALAVRVLASAPWPTVRFFNGTVEPQQLEATFTNVDIDADWSATVAAIVAGARRDPQCTQERFTERGEVVVAPPAFDALDATTLRVSVGLEACTSLSLQSALSVDAPTLRLAVIGPADGDLGWLGRALNAAVRAEPDVIVSLGGVRSPRGGYSAASDRFAATGAPRVVVFGRDDRRAAGTFRATFGQTDFAWAAGRLNGLVLDTADARLAADQLELLRQVSPAGGGWFTTDTFSMGGDATDGLRSEPQAARVVEALRRAELTQAFSSASARGQTRTFAGITLHTMLGGRRGQDDQLWLLDVVDPWGEARIELEQLPFAAGLSAP